MSLELAVLTPVFLGLALLLVGAGYLPLARLHVDSAAQDAARAATLASSVPQARTDASAAARDSLAREHISCAQLDVDVDLANFTPSGSVSVAVRCTLDLTWLHLPGLHLAKTVQGSATVLTDVYQNEPAP